MKERRPLEERLASAGEVRWEQTVVQEACEELHDSLVAEHTVVIATKGPDIFIGAWVPEPAVLKSLLVHALMLMEQDPSSVVDLREKG